MKSIPSISPGRLGFRYPKGMAFQCERCGLCCRDTPRRARHILALRSEAQRISEKKGLRTEDFAEEAGGAYPYEYALRKRLDGACVFLEGNSCAIYELRPLVCRFYPVYLRMAHGKGYVFSFTKECPGLGKGKPLPRTFFEGLLEQALEELKARKESQVQGTKFLCQRGVGRVALA